MMLYWIFFKVPHAGAATAVPPASVRNPNLMRMRPFAG